MTHTRRRIHNPLNDLHTWGSDLEPDLVEDCLPESYAWQDLCKARSRHDDPGVAEGLGLLQGLLARRRAGEALSVVDRYPDEAELADDQALGDTWRELKTSVVAGDLDRADLLLGSLAETMAPK
ncbi:hypothetical protein ACFL6C_04345 [Myxococcota bacterium]